MIEILGNERIGANDQRISRARRGAVRNAGERQAGVFDFVDLRDIAQQDVPHQIVDVLHQLVLTVVGLSSGSSGGRRARSRRIGWSGRCSSAAASLSKRGGGEANDQIEETHGYRSDGALRTLEQARRLFYAITLRNAALN